jgi:hypothetical protein
MQHFQIPNRFRFISLNIHTSSGLNIFYSGASVENNNS